MADQIASFYAKIGADAGEFSKSMAGVKSELTASQTMTQQWQDGITNAIKVGGVALAAMGGAVTNLAAVKHQLASYDPEVVQGTVLDRAEIDRQIELYRSRDTEARRGIVGLQPKRAEIILAGACIVRTVMERLGKDFLTVSDRGLRHGVLAERFSG